MGFYFNNGQNKGKGEALVREHGAREVSQIEAALYVGSDTHAAICVVNNGPFEAAALAFDKAEYDVFADPLDHRPKKWYALDKQTAYRLTDFKG